MAALLYRDCLELFLHESDSFLGSRQIASLDQRQGRE
jgi:hypothetical protein